MMLVLLIAVSPLSPTVNAQSVEVTKLDYVALGDSLAAGVNHQDQLGMGYSDFLALQMKQTLVLGDYSKQYAYPGYTSAEVLADLKNNVFKPNMDGSPDTDGIQKQIMEAEVVTLNAGANDLLAVIDIDPKTGVVSYDEVAFAKAISQVGVNIGSTVGLIKTLNPNADVYVMGYYNSFPYLPDTEQPKLLAALDNLNKSIQTAAVSTGATYVPTADAFNPNGKTYLPNPKNIHPNEAGYLVLANAFWRAMEVKDSQDFSDVNDQMYSYDAIQTLVQKGIIIGYGNGKFGPEDSVRRDHAAQMLTRSIVYNPNVPPASFSDLLPTNPAFAEISVLSHYKVLNGYHNGTFRPTIELNRAEMAKIIVTAFNLKGTGKQYFDDNTVEEYWAYDYINILAENGITIGVGNNRYHPEYQVQREEFATFIYRALQKQTTN
ncbi:S-layer homology domain-containing protein [Pseudalkalibacillus berkeleyi]|uniref:S-layer homology domain-containing protein n=1 Tax=Pseudalkalibacillus berkeleyi TaxID=1069813 RepID=A0ABS9H3Y1_9BACL|nr:S-layer homology domain-containing protein [Pseudalkalibacillus berkeleyi]MCF6138811.1 S-layer homology domain-containing protein [Pseudalkalibacillus berkeleyi]